MERLTKSEEKVLELMKYCSSQSEDGQFTLGIKTVMDRYGLSKPTVINAIKKLSELGIVTRTEKGNNFKNTASTYSLDQGKILPPQGKKTQGKISDSQGKKFDPVQGKKMHGKEASQGKKIDPNNILYNNITKNNNNILTECNDNILGSNSKNFTHSNKSKIEVNDLSSETKIDGSMFYDKIQCCIITLKSKESTFAEKQQSVQQLIEIRDSGKLGEKQAALVEKWITPNIKLIQQHQPTSVEELFDKCCKLYDNVRKEIHNTNYNDLIIDGTEWLLTVYQLKENKRKLPKRVINSQDYFIKTNKESNIYEKVVDVLTKFGIIDSNGAFVEEVYDAYKQLIQLTNKFISTIEQRDYVIEEDKVRDAFSVRIVQLINNNQLIEDINAGRFGWEQIQSKLQKHNNSINAL